MKTATLFILVFLFAKSGYTATVVSPAPAGSGAFEYPFFSRFPGRFQQVYDANQFLGAMPLGGSISRITFNRDGYIPGISTIITNVQLRFSTTTASASSLSSVFASNIGTDETLVFSGQLIFEDNGAGFSEPIAFSSPFLYDPRQGNLLMEVRHLTGANNLNNNPRPGFETAYGGTSIALHSSSSSASTAEAVMNGFGLLTQFTFTPIPEPSSARLVIFGGAFLALIQRYRKKYMKSRRAADSAGADANVSIEDTVFQNCTCSSIVNLEVNGSDVQEWACEIDGNSILLADPIETGGKNVTK